MLKTEKWESCRMASCWKRWKSREIVDFPKEKRRDHETMAFSEEKWNDCETAFSEKEGFHDPTGFLKALFLNTDAETEEFLTLI